MRRTVEIRKEYAGMDRCMCCCGMPCFGMEKLHRKGDSV